MKFFTPFLLAFLSACLVPATNAAGKRLGSQKLGCYIHEGCKKPHGAEFKDHGSKGKGWYCNDQKDLHHDTKFDKCSHDMLTPHGLDHCWCGPEYSHHDHKWMCSCPDLGRQLKSEHKKIGCYIHKGCTHVGVELKEHGSKGKGWYCSDHKHLYHDTKFDKCSHEMVTDRGLLRDCWCGNAFYDHRDQKWTCFCSDIG